MDEIFKKKWVEALRSGKYKQGLGQLRYGRGNNERYCCLGVAACLLGTIDTYFNGVGSLYDKDVLAIQLSVEDEDSLIDLNDGEKLTFEEIAYYIEAL